MMPLEDLAMSGFILFTVIMREKSKSSKTFMRAHCQGAFEETFTCEVEAAKCVVMCKASQILIGNSENSSNPK